MLKLERWRMVKYFGLKEKFINDETGATNVIEIAMLLVVIIAIAALFKEGITGIANTLMERINSEVSPFTSGAIFSE